MTSRKTVTNSNESEDVLMTDDTDFSETEEQQEPTVRNKGFNLDMRHKIESRLEQRRLDKELDDYKYFDIGDDD